MKIKDYTPPILDRKIELIRNIFPRYFGLNKLDKILEEYINFDNGFFVELGANDGVTQSNTLYYERYRKWTGILIEPSPHNYIKCRRNRDKRSKVYCNACTSFQYNEKFVEIAYSNLMSAPLGLDSDIHDPKQHAEHGLKHLPENDEVFTFGAIASPLERILEDADAPDVIDLLSLDVEGAELEVLKGIDHSKRHFRYMCIESRQPERILDYLSQFKYKMVKKLTHHDYLLSRD